MTVKLFKETSLLECKKNVLFPIVKIHMIRYVPVKYYNSILEAVRGLKLVQETLALHFEYPPPKYMHCCNSNLLPGFGLQSLMVPMGAHLLTINI